MCHPERRRAAFARRSRRTPTARSLRVVQRQLFARGASFRSLLSEEHVVVLAAVEGRVEVDEVDRFVLDVLTEDGEVVAVIELVFFHWGEIVARILDGRNLLVWSRSSECA